jgi:hypothetical protein
MSKIEVDAIDKQSGSTLTLGGSGTAVTLACGATQTGFGRTGTVDWQTSIKTAASFTAVNGEGYFVDTSSNAVTANLPAGSAGAIVSFKDYAQNFDTNALTIAANGSEKIEGLTTDLILSTEGIAVTLVYGDATKGWQAVNSNEIVNSVKFIAATGGTVTTVCTNFKVHTFTGPGTFCVSCGGNAAGSNTVDYLVVAGGGAGATIASNNTGKGGGGGAGGYRESSGAASGCYTVSPLGSGVSALPVSATAFPITVGAGGAIAPTSSQTEGNSGVNSTFSTITSAGGGGGGASNPGSAGVAGGSGGGGAYCSSVAGGAGNTPPTSPAQGTSGGNGRPCVPYSAGGGGGATVAGTDATDPASGPGGAGATSSINGTPTARAGGGGGSGKSFAPTPSTTGTGGTGGGGAGGTRTGPTASTAGTAGTANTGGGGGGGNPGSGNPAGSVAGAGGSGIVIIRYKFQ